MGTPKHRRRFLWPVVGVVAVGAVATWYFVGGASDEAVAPEYDSVKVARGALSASVTASGTLSPLVTVEVGSQVSGRIQQLFADYNSLVKKGEVIAKIDPRLFETEVAKMKANQLVARAAVQRAEAELKDASVRRDRAVTLAKQGIVTLADRDAAEATFATAAAQLESSKATLVQVRASLEQAQANLTYTTIVSPIDGVVISRSVDVGQTVTAAMTTPTLFTIAEDLRKMEVHTSVAESDVGRLAPGLDVEFTVDAYPTDRFQGTVKEVRYSPQTVQNVVTYDAVVSVENPEAKLRPGMTADVTFLVEERPNVLMIPNAALRFKPADPTLAAEGTKVGAGGGSGHGGGAAGGGPGPGGAGAGAHGGGRPGAVPGVSKARVVWAIDGSKNLRAAHIVVGISDGVNTEVQSGELKEGDAVVTGLAVPTGDATRKSTFGRFL